ncbi:hypothetical protein IAT38_003088 [Cryptococcus sp. DSM 104549]
MAAPPTPPPNLDPPFRGYIETTYDALLVFEAARRGMIPRVTRRLIERERGMVQSGAVFVFDEHESGIKRWTDGLVWSPSRILGNFLVYRETDRRNANSGKNSNSKSPTESSPSGSNAPLARPTTATAGNAKLDGAGVGTGSGSGGEDGGDPPALGQGALARPRSSSEGGGSVDRQRERQLVGSLTNSYRFKEGGLVKKTMSVNVHGFAQHVVSYYTIEDCLAGKLRTPSTIPELSALEISQDYLHKQNFRFPPMIETGADGILRYRGEPEEPNSPHSPTSQYSFQNFPPSSATSEYFEVQPYPPPINTSNRVSSPRSRQVTMPMQIPISPAHSMQGGSGSYMGPSSAGSNYYESPSVGGMPYGGAPPIARQNSSSSITSSASAIRPGSSARRYQPYGGSSGSLGHRGSSGSMSYPSAGGVGPGGRRQSGSDTQETPYPPDAYDVKPNSNGAGGPGPYYHHPPPSATGSFGGYYHIDGPPPQQVESPMTSPTYAPNYHPWQSLQAPPPGGPAASSRLLPSGSRPDFNPSSAGAQGPPSSAGSGSSGGGAPIIGAPPHGQPGDWHGAPAPGVGPAPGHGPGGWDMSGTPSPGYLQSIHPAHDEWRQNAGAMA